jgi:hypothetical protein
VTNLVLDVNGLSIRMAHSLRKTPTCEARGGRFLFFETPGVPAPTSPKLSCGLKSPLARRAARGPAGRVVRMHAAASPVWSGRFQIDADYD